MAAQFILAADSERMVYMDLLRQANVEIMAG